jgi:tRNA/rRNA methyltransferase
MTTAIILVEPQGPLNLGSVARVMKNFNLTDLRLVAPLCSPLDLEAQHMAVHAKDVLAGATEYASLGEALIGCDRVVGTTGRIHPLIPTLTPTATFAWLTQSQQSALVFGPEDRGLSNEELALCQHWLTLPTNPQYPSLNLAQAVGICCYLLANDEPTLIPVSPLAPHEHLEGFYGQLAETLLAIGYTLPHTQTSRMEKLRRIFGRADLSTEEVTLLRGILRQVRWAHKETDS